MAEKLLNALLYNEISTEVLFQWISEKNQQRNQTFFEFSRFPCTTGEFISYFLNYVHEDAPSFDTFTTKSAINNCKNKSEQQLTKKRTSLLSDIENDMKITHSHTSPVISIKCSYDADKCNVSGDGRVYGSSTPKLMKIQSDNTLDNSYMSPISPLYSRNNFGTPRSRNSFPKSSEKSLCLGDFIVQKKTSAKKKAQRNLSDIIDKKEYNNSENKKSRRINPTNLNQKKFNNSFNVSENSFNFKNSFIELSVDNLNEQRNLLVEERLKIKNNIDDLVKVPNVKLQTFSSKIEIKALPEKITFMPQLDMLINVYVYFLNNNYNLNLASEIYFLISLLLSKQYMNDNLDNSDSDIQILEENSVDQKDIFKTVHNCVYFAVNALKLLVENLSVLDRTTLKLLYENERLKLFSKDFSTILISIYSSKSEQLRESVENIQNNVCFISDTDNRDNFASDASFHAFRKQRDLFYEILRIWEQNHFMSDWNFSIALGGKIRSLLNLHNDPVNYRHFARLFKMQLLTTCRQSNNDEQPSSILSSIPNVDADKLYRLKNRLVTKQDDNNLNSTPTFTGDQEFYKEFILASAFHVFHAHLRDSLILEITQLTSFSEILENDEKDNAVDGATRNSYFASLKVLRTLAKFLGFLESIPYRTDNKVVSEKVARAEIETRKWYQPSFDLKLVILNSLKSRTLTLSVPWICTYLSMLDYVALRLPYFAKILETLFCIYYSTRPRSDRSSSLLYNVMLVKLCLGWLFELPHFPSELYFNWISNLSGKDLSKFLHLNLTNLSLDQTKSNNDKDRKASSLDELDIVDQTILYTFCPYLEGFRKLLAMNSSNARNVVKHITPLSASESVDVSEKKLKFQLEQAFFDGQPVSVRKTVEFTSERVASSCVKHICNNLVPEFKKNSLEEVKITFQNIKDNCEDNKLLESILTTKANELSSQHLRRLQEVCTSETEKLTNERIAASIDSLLAVDELQQTKNTCVAIAKRLCIERVQQWVKSHVTIGLFSKAFNMEVQKVMIPPDKDPRNKPPFVLPSGGRNVNHNDDTHSAVKIVENIRNLSTDLLETKTICSASIQDTLKAAEKTILERCDVNDHILRLINRMLVDLILLILTHKTECFEENVLLFVEHWKRFAKDKEQLFETLICPRNVMLVGQSKNVSKSWLCLSEFVIKLIEVELISCENFESQCIQIYQNDWDVVTQKNLSTCFQAVLDGVANKGPNVNKFTYLLNFLSSYCSNMDH